MNMICPVTNFKVNETTTRLNALFTVLFLGVFLVTKNHFILSFVVFDFMMRAFFKNRLSVISGSSKFIIDKIDIKPNLINAGPKLFAARVGFFLSSFSLITNLSGALTLSLIVSCIILFFAFLEAAFSFCVACKLYPFVYRFEEFLSK